MNQFRVCDKCKGTNINSLLSKLREIDPHAEIIVGCQNFCGIGARKPFVIYNHVPIVADTEEELINKIKDEIEK